MTQTKAGRDPEGAEKQIAAQAQERSTCRTCGGKKMIDLPVRSELPGAWATQLCPECGGQGTVPAGPQGDLAQWREEAEQLVEEAKYRLPTQQTAVASRLLKLSAHLAAMPQAQPVAELLKTPPELVAVEEWCCECSEQPADSLILVAGGILDWFCDDCGSKELVKLRAAIAQHETGAPA